MFLTFCLGHQQTDELTPVHGQEQAACRAVPWGSHTLVGTPVVTGTRFPTHELRIAERFLRLLYLIVYGSDGDRSETVTILALDQSCIGGLPRNGASWFDAGSWAAPDAGSSPSIGWVGDPVREAAYP